MGDLEVESMELTGMEPPTTPASLATGNMTPMTSDAKQKRKVSETDDALVVFVNQEAKRRFAESPSMDGGEAHHHSNLSALSASLRSDEKNLCRGVSPLVVSDWLQTFKDMTEDMRIDALNELLSICEPGLVRHLEAMIVPRFQIDFICILPSEVTLRIFDLLSPMDLCHTAQVSKTWLRASEDNLLWTRKCELLPSTRDIRNFPPALARRANWEAVALSLQQELLRRPSLVLINLHNRHLLPFAQRVRNPGWPSTSAAGAPSSLNQLPLRDPSTSHQSADGEAPTASLVHPPMESCFTRARRKAEYLRCRKIVNNWRQRRPTAECQLRGHDEHVITCLQVHGDLIVTGSDDNSVRVWSAATAQCLHLLIGHTGGVWTLLLSRDGKLIISGSTDRTVCVWDAEIGDRMHTLQCLQSGHVSTVRCMALKDDVLVSGSRDCTLRVWNIREGRCLRTLYGHGAAVRCVQFDGRRIVSGSYDCGIIVWDAKSGKQLHMLEGHTNKVYSLLLEGERDLVISGSLDTTIRVWNIATGECLQTLTGHDSLTSGMQLKGNTLVSANADSTIKVWDISQGRCIHTLAGPSRHASAVTSLQLLDSGMVVSSGDDGNVKLWDLQDGSFVRDLVRLESSGAGGCIWRLKATKTMLVCAAGSRNGTEDTKLILMDFDAPYP